MSNSVEFYNEDFDVYVESSDAEIVALIQELLDELTEDDYWFYDEEEDVLYYYDEDDDEWYEYEDDEEEE